MDGVFENQVRLRAYEIWMALGQTHGQAHEHWVTAERDLMAAPVVAKTPKARRAPAKAKSAKVETHSAESITAASTKASFTKGKAATKAAAPTRVTAAKAPKKMASAKAGKPVAYASDSASA